LEVRPELDGLLLVGAGHQLGLDLALVALGQLFTMKAGAEGFLFAAAVGLVPPGVPAGLVLAQVAHVLGLLKYPGPAHGSPSVTGATVGRGRPGVTTVRIGGIPNRPRLP